MKYQLVKPELNSVDLAKINKLSDYMGWLFKFNSVKGSALVETLEKNVGYIQKDMSGVFIIWKDTEDIEYIDKLINITLNYKRLFSWNKKLNYLTKIFELNGNCAFL